MTLLLGRTTDPAAPALSPGHNTRLWSFDSTRMGGTPSQGFSFTPHVTLVCNRRRARRRIRMTGIADRRAAAARLGAALRDLATACVLSEVPAAELDAVAEQARALTA